MDQGKEKAKGEEEEESKLGQRMGAAGRIRVGTYVRSFRC